MRLWADEVTALSVFIIQPKSPPNIVRTKNNISFNFSIIHPHFPHKHHPLGRGQSKRLELVFLFITPPKIWHVHFDHSHISSQQIASSCCPGELQETTATADEILFA